MKTRISVKKAEPVPARGKVVIAAICMMLFSASVFTGMKLAPDGDIPVCLANGEVITPPYYITIDGHKAALVDSRETAQDVINDVVGKYSGDSEEIIDIRLMEETSIDKMQIKNGDEMPNILTEEEAVKKLINGKKGEAYLTVVITKEKTQHQLVEYEEEYKPDPAMYVGETRVETAGSDGLKEITKVVVTENGKTVDEEVVEEEMLKEPVEQITLTGTKAYSGYGGGEGVIDEGVSYDGSAVYETLKTPVSKVCISSPFGPRWGRLHTGVDLALSSGEDVYAADSGTVYYAGYCGGYGNLVKIDHGNGMQTYYAHNSKLLASSGQKVKKGEKIALIGSTGNSTGPHLHFEVIINGVRVDPVSLLDIQ